MAGHNSIGLTVQDPSVAAFDPVFWFFHANWDRVYWKWQTSMKATDLIGLLAHLLKDGKVIASRAFFQPNEVEKCPTCVQNPVVHFDFKMPIEAVSGGTLGVWVEPLNQSVVGDHFPNKLMGNPTVEGRLLLSTE